MCGDCFLNFHGDRIINDTSHGIVGFN